MIRAVLLVATLLASQAHAKCPGAEQLSEALSIVFRSHPVLLAEREEFQETIRTKNWDAYVRVGYAARATDKDAEGLNASVQVKIPLFDRTPKLAAAKARSAWKRSEDQVRKAFLAELEELCVQAGKVREFATLRTFYRDRLSYRQERVNEGLEDPPVLWSEAEQVQKTDYDWRRESGELEAMRLTLARRYGGEEWSGLQVLLTAMTR